MTHIWKADLFTRSREVGFLCMHEGEIVIFFRVTNQIFMTPPILNSRSLSIGRYLLTEKVALYNFKFMEVMGPCYAMPTLNTENLYNTLHNTQGSIIELLNVDVKLYWRDPTYLLSGRGRFGPLFSWVGGGGAGSFLTNCQ